MLLIRNFVDYEHVTSKDSVFKHGKLFLLQITCLFVTNLFKFLKLLGLTAKSKVLGLVGHPD